ncbi:putative uncharacterized protein DDB_G0282133 [Temnothorax curvispinosus]|uniref:Uncharacterized protein n=1 Tax=Temnothorax curvispinosus TaxID=300111 RepID=A0A6J1PJR3_9HYME|nr:putative uncharacterized protein DDB_G0282133 [Temnothorax curvispinosus]
MNDLSLSITTNAALNTNISNTNTNIEDDICALSNKNFHDVERHTECDVETNVESNSNSTLCNNKNLNDDIRKSVNLQDALIINKSNDFLRHNNNDVISGKFLRYAG